MHTLYVKVCNADFSSFWLSCEVVFSLIYFAVYYCPPCLSSGIEKSLLKVLHRRPEKDKEF